MKKSEKSENTKAQTKPAKVGLVVVALVALTMAIIAGASFNAFRVEAARFDRLLRVVVLEVVGSDKLVDAGIETWPSIAEGLDHFDNATSAIAILCGITIALALGGILFNEDSTAKDIAELKTAIEEQNVKLDQIRSSIALGQYISDDKNVKTVQEIFETITTTAKMLERLVEDYEHYGDIDTADSSALDDD